MECIGRCEVEVRVRKTSRPRTSSRLWMDRKRGSFRQALGCCCRQRTACPPRAFSRSRVCHGEAVHYGQLGSHRKNLGRPQRQRNPHAHRPHRPYPVCRHLPGWPADHYRQPRWNRCNMGRSPARTSCRMAQRKHARQLIFKCQPVIPPNQSSILRFTEKSWNSSAGFCAERKNLDSLNLKTHNGVVHLIANLDAPACFIAMRDLPN